MQHHASLAEEQSINNELPMYGGHYSPDMPPNKEWSHHASDLGWKYFYSGDLSTAMKRFNQAWMFDGENPDAYWGFGIIVGRKTRDSHDNPESGLKESINLLETALKKAPEEKKSRILVDAGFSYALLGSWYSYNKNKLYKENFDKASSYFEKSKNIDPQYPLLYANWSDLDMFEGDPKHAKEMLDKAKSLGFKPSAGK